MEVQLANQWDMGNIGLPNFLEKFNRSLGAVFYMLFCCNILQ